MFSFFYWQKIDAMTIKLVIVRGVCNQIKGFLHKKNSLAIGIDLKYNLVFQNNSE